MWDSIKLFFSIISEAISLWREESLKLDGRNAQVVDELTAAQKIKKAIDDMRSKPDIDDSDFLDK